MCKSCNFVLKYFNAIQIGLYGTEISKPLAIVELTVPWEIDALREMLRTVQQKVFTIFIIILYLGG